MGIRDISGTAKSLPGKPVIQFGGIAAGNEREVLPFNAIGEIRARQGLGDKIGKSHHGLWFNRKADLIELHRRKLPMPSNFPKTAMSISDNRGLFARSS